MLVISGLSPSSAVAGSSGFTLSVTGSSFNKKCVVEWNGQARATTVLSSTRLTAAISSSDIASAGIATVSVLNQRTGTMSNSLSFTISSPTALSSTVAVAISPQSVSLLTGGTQQFTATVSGSTNTAVVWSASGGTISSSGLYAAPSSAGNYTVTATSVADSSKSASATVTVTAPIAVTVSPASVSLAAGGSQQFSATVSNTTNTGVTWTTSGGAISAAGLYVAPSTAGSYTVTATSVADPTKSGTSTVSVSAAATTVSVAISPVAPSLLTGGTQQFTATVSGTTNTAVTWSASGGTVSSSGLYTAPSTAGTYTVTATSVADTTKQASASVTVSAPVAHSAQLSWLASTSSVAGYKVYRSTVSGSQYVLLNSQVDPLLSYADDTVQAGQTYYYVLTAVSLTGVESGYSNQVTAVIPTP